MAEENNGSSRPSSSRKNKKQQEVDDFLSSLGEVEGKKGGEGAKSLKTEGGKGGGEEEDMLAFLDGIGKKKGKSGKKLEEKEKKEEESKSETVEVELGTTEQDNKPVVSKETKQEEVNQLPKPEVKVKEEPKPTKEAEVKPEVKSEPKQEVKTEPKPEVKSEVKPEVKTEVKPELKPEPNTEVKQEVKTEVKPEVKPEVPTSNPTTQKTEPAESSNSWSFGGLWSTASSAIKSTQNSDYLQTMKSALSDISETVRSNENAQYLGSTVKDLVDTEKLVKMGTDFKTLTQQSVSSVMASFQEEGEGHTTLNIFIHTDQEYKKVENLAYQMLDPILEEELLFQDINFHNAGEVINQEDSFWKEKLSNTKLSQGFKEGFELAKKLAQQLSSDYLKSKDQTTKDQPEPNTESKSDALFAKLEDKILCPTTTTNAFLVVVPCRAAPLPDSARLFYSLVLLSPDYPDHLFHTFSQPLPVCSPLYPSKPTSTTSLPLSPTSEADHREVALKAIQTAFQFLLVDFFDTLFNLQKLKQQHASQIAQL